MPKFLEEKLKKEYPDNPKAVYGTMNKLGYMKGNKETAKGKKAEEKHERKVHMAKKMTKASHIFPKEFRRYSPSNYDLKKMTNKK